VNFFVTKVYERLYVLEWKLVDENEVAFRNAFSVRSIGSEKLFIKSERGPESLILKVKHGDAIISIRCCNEREEKVLKEGFGNVIQKAKAKDEFKLVIKDDYGNPIDFMPNFVYCMDKHGKIVEDYSTGGIHVESYFLKWKHLTIIPSRDMDLFQVVTRKNGVECVEVGRSPSDCIRIKNL